ncbi:plasmid stabilization protein ParE [Pollutimonas subterranea]|uniref:Toxin n=1 Tax=Pollutimonas subterranea TaxID=2045210 RepID=A0A2N4U4E1_9BURK|nr:type II toxin-antitoxin system RelE/ParE family toxin [Pollutimonas subterranea]PLC49884.1 plasmid stabilization protein ParE [Pollutimonas subterranea]
MSAKKREIRLRPLAEADLEKIWLYTFEHWSLEQADKYVSDLVTTMERLACEDKTGRVCSVRDGYFQYAVGSHIVFYRVTPLTLDVTRVLHQRMDIERHL